MEIWLWVIVAPLVGFMAVAALIRFVTSDTFTRAVGAPLVRRVAIVLGLAMAVLILVALTFSPVVLLVLIPAACVAFFWTRREMCAERLGARFSQEGGGRKPEFLTPDERRGRTPDRGWGPWGT